MVVQKLNTRHHPEHGEMFQNKIKKQTPEEQNGRTCPKKQKQWKLEVTATYSHFSNFY